MLARAALRSLRARSLPAQQRLPVQFRTYAKKPKHRDSYEYKPPTHFQSDRHSPNARRPNEPAATARWETNAAKEKNIQETIPKVSSKTNQIDAKQTPEKLESTDSDASQQFVSHISSPNDTSRVYLKQSPSKPLPDLTQGIPSTIAAEIEAASKQSNPASLNITEASSESSGSGGGGGDLPKSAYISSFERRRNRWANYFYAFTLFTATTSTVLLGRNWETEEEERRHPDAPSGWGMRLFYNRLRARLSGTLDYYNEPAFEKLLPNTDPSWERPYTLVLSLEDLLVHSEWDREHGWRMAKRPGIDYFLRYLSQYYELVIFTSVPSMIGQPIINKLDPYHIVMWPLFREATRYKKGEYIKDLSFLNRPLNRIIMLDTDSTHTRNQPENAIILSKWKGDPKDKELVSFIPFLEYVASMEFNDTRDVIKSFKGTHVPTEYAKREAIARERWLQQLDVEKKKSSKRPIGGLGSLFGMRPAAAGADGMDQSLSEGFAKGKMYQDQVRERGQKNYEILEREIRENGEKWLKEMAEEEKKMNEEAMKGMKNSITSVFPFGKPGPPPPPSSS